MSEREVVEKSGQPATIESLREDLVGLGVGTGMMILVHSSLSSIGWVSGGPVAVIHALEDVIGPSGTLVMPTHSTGLTDPSNWQNPPVPEDWWQIFRDTVPAFDPDLTPTRSMGAIAETFRKQRGVVRSYHPKWSFSAWGALAEAVVQDHELAFGMGDGSPLARIYDLGGYVLLLGVGYDSNSSIHLAEYRCDFPGKAVVQEGAPVTIKGERQWVPFDELDLSTNDFQLIGQAFEDSEEDEVIRCGKIGLAECRLMKQRHLVDFAIKWMSSNRS
ncbi:MAG: AAC(3) family N-acetyltransferase [Candidatus Latescibacteria bacterium]|nr:AAC(3) family N-acetyltransferase [Candidatus Latescibacterota bacterium]